jgi:DNA repair protein RadC
MPFDLTKARPMLRTPEEVYAQVGPLFVGEKREIVALALRDTRGRLIHREILYRGTLNEVLVHPREIFHLALKHCAHDVILVHNHPSGDVSPSLQDITLTKQLVQAGSLLGIPLFDHLIIAAGQFISFKQLGLLPQAKEELLQKTLRLGTDSCEWAHED